METVLSIILLYSSIGVMFAIYYKIQTVAEFFAATIAWPYLLFILTMCWSIKKWMGD